MLLLLLLLFDCPPALTISFCTVCLYLQSFCRVIWSRSLWNNLCWLKFILLEHSLTAMPNTISRWLTGGFGWIVMKFCTWFSPISSFRFAPSCVQQNTAILIKIRGYCNCFFFINLLILIRGSVLLSKNNVNIMCNVLSFLTKRKCTDSYLEVSPENCLSRLYILRQVLILKRLFKHVKADKVFVSTDLCGHGKCC